MLIVLEYRSLLEKLMFLKICIGKDKNARPNELFYEIAKTFTERDILILKDGEAIPEDYKSEDYK